MRPWLPFVFVLVSAVAGAGAADAQRFGDALGNLPAAKLEDVLAKPEDGRKVRLEGTVKTVCRNKGCWLELEQGTRSIHVTFKDYAFFVPKDAAGRTVVAEGLIRVKKESASDLAHLKAEGAKAADAGVSFEAAAVELR
jgi:hypothetical protein